MAKENIVVGLDIGTTKICVIIGEINNSGGVDIVGIGISPSKGLRKGVVINLESTTKSIERALEEAELMAGINIERAYVGIAGGHIKCFNSRGVIAVSRKKHDEVTVQDVERVLEAAKAIAIPLDREVIHVLPQEYIVDDQDGIRDPVGMVGVRLEAEVHIVTGAITSAQNVIRSVNKAGLEVEDIVLEPLGSSLSVLSDEERELGVAIIDIGGGTTDLAVFINGSIRHTSVLPIGGDHVTNDIAIGLRTPNSAAEDLKIKHGCAKASLVSKDEEIEVASVGGRRSRSMQKQILAEIIEPRMEEVFSLIKNEMVKGGFDDLVAAGLVITGGMANLEGICELAEKTFEMPVRVGIPVGVGGLIDVVNGPAFATGVGLVKYGVQAKLEGRQGQFRDQKNMFVSILARMKHWFEDFF